MKCITPLTSFSHICIECWHCWHWPSRNTQHDEHAAIGGLLWTFSLAKFAKIQWKSKSSRVGAFHLLGHENNLRLRRRGCIPLWVETHLFCRTDDLKLLQNAKGMPRECQRNANLVTCCKLEILGWVSRCYRYSPVFIVESFWHL